MSERPRRAAAAAAKKLVTISSDSDSSSEKLSEDDEDSGDYLVAPPQKRGRGRPPGKSNKRRPEAMRSQDTPPVSGPGKRGRPPKRPLEDDDDEEYDPRKDNQHMATSYAVPKLRPGPASVKVAAAAQMGINVPQHVIQQNIHPIQPRPAPVRVTPTVNQNVASTSGQNNNNVQQVSSASSLLSSIATQVRNQNPSGPITITLKSQNCPQLISQLLNAYQNTTGIRVPQPVAPNFSVPRRGRPPIYSNYNRTPPIPMGSGPTSVTTIRYTTPSQSNQQKLSSNISMTPVTSQLSHSAPSRDYSRQSREDRQKKLEEKENQELASFEKDIISSIVCMSNMTLDLECEEIIEDDGDDYKREVQPDFKTIGKKPEDAGKKTYIESNKSGPEIRTDKSKDVSDPKDDSNHGEKMITSQEIPVIVGKPEHKKVDKEYAADGQNQIDTLYMTCKKISTIGASTQASKHDVTGIQTEVYNKKYREWTDYVYKRELWKSRGARIRVGEVVEGHIGTPKPALSSPAPSTIPTPAPRTTLAVTNTSQGLTISRVAVPNPALLSSPSSTGIIRSQPLLNPNPGLLRTLTSPAFASITRSSQVSGSPLIQTRPIHPSVAAAPLTIPANVTPEQALAILQSITQNSSRGVPTLIMPHTR